MAKQAFTYTVEPGRHIYCNGVPFISIGREGLTRPHEADAMAHRIAALLNADLEPDECVECGGRFTATRADKRPICRRCK